MQNVGIALLLVVGAGAATGLGAMVVFFPFLVKYAKTKTLAGALGLSAGVMTYVSFVEIFKKSNDSFVEAGHGPDKAHIYATGCFFLGVILMVTLNYGVTALLGGHHHHHHHGTFPGSDEDAKKQPKTQSEELSRGSCNLQRESISVQPPCCSDDPAHDLAQIQKMAEEIEEEMEEEAESGGIVDDEQGVIVDNERGGSIEPHAPQNHHHEEKLMRMSVNTAVAIALHNFPEGLATFVATLNDPKVGAVLATAIAIHNIPEGLCVAMPIYYATGNRWKAFRWGVLSGVSEPIAALLGWAVLANSFSDTLYAIMFGIVAGMMVIISARELLPTAHRYDPEDSVVTYSFIGGMFIMALSLVLFMI